VQSDQLDEDGGVGAVLLPNPSPIFDDVKSVKRHVRVEKKRSLSTNQMDICD
jgi:hypothetical protein